MYHPHGGGEGKATVSSFNLAVVNVKHLSVVKVFGGTGQFGGCEYKLPFGS